MPTMVSMSIQRKSLARLIVYEKKRPPEPGAAKCIRNNLIT